MTASTSAKERATGPGAVVAVAYGVVCYLAFTAVFAYTVAFLADVVVPRSVDDGGPAASAGLALAIDTVLLLVFAVPHSVMARPGFKRWWVRLVPAHVERSTYVLVATMTLALLVWQWRPVPAVVWDVSGPARLLVWSTYAAGWAWVLAMSHAIDHFDLFGVSRVVRHLRGLPAGAPAFALPFPYRLVRHPMMLGFIVAFVAAPTMTAGHLLFAVLGCGYVLVGVRLEERDLADELPEYAAYAATTPRLLPRLSPRRTTDA